MIQRIPKINIPATIAMCATFAVSALLVQVFRPAYVRPFCGMDVLPLASSPVPTETIRYQSDSPIKLVLVTTRLTSARTQLLTRNVSGRPITGYALIFTLKDSAYSGSIATYVTSTDFPTTLDVNASVQSDIDPASVKEVWVDFVEFSDGTIWGPNTTKTLEKINAVRMGSRQAALEYSWLLSTRGPQAMLESLSQPITNSQLDQYDQLWRDAFKSGVESVRGRLLSNKDLIDDTMKSRSGQAYNAALTERFKETLQAYINFRR